MLKTTTPVRVRSTTNSGQNTAKHRNQIYKSAFARITEASNLGFFLEAITLIESLVSDRVESRLSYKGGEDFSFKTLEKLIKKSQKLETDLVMKTLVESELQVWAGKRNRALHEMAKIESGDVSNWDERYALLKPVVDSGVKLLRNIDRQVNKLRRSA